MKQTAVQIRVKQLKQNKCRQLTFKKLEKRVKHLIDMLNFAYEESQKAKDDLVTYDDDSQADHEDGQYCGRVRAYAVVMKKCAQLIVDENYQP